MNKGRIRWHTRYHSGSYWVALSNIQAPDKQVQYTTCAADCIILTPAQSRIASTKLTQAAIILSRVASAVAIPSVIVV